MRGGGFRSCWSGLEQLETRALPSTVASVQILHIDVLENHQGAIEVGLLVADTTAGRVVSTHSADSDRDDQAGVGKTGSGRDASSASAVRTNSETGGGKSSRSQNAISREITPDPMVVATRRPEEPGEDALDGNPLTSGQDTVSGQGGGTAAEPADAVSLVGWSSGGAMALLTSNAIFTGSLIGPDGRLKLSALDPAPLGSGRSVASELNVSASTSHGRQTGVAVHDEDSAPLDGTLAITNRDAHAWTGLMEGALHADWEVVDREFRQFLSGLGSLAGDTDGSGTGRLWPLGIGVAMALVAARRAASGRRGLFRSPIHEVLRVSARRTIPSGPWPLGTR